MSESKIEIEHSEDYRRLLNIYDSIDGEELLDSLANALASTHQSGHTAMKVAMQVVHAHGGSERRMMPSYKLTADWEDEESSDEYLDNVFIDNMTILLNRYVKFIKEQNDDYKLKSLVIFLITRKLYDLLPNIEFDETQKADIESITNKVLEMKDELVEELITTLKDHGLEDHAEVADKHGLLVFGIKTGKAIAKYFADLQEPNEDLDLYEVLLDLRARYLKLDKSQLNVVLELIGLTERTWQRRSSVIVSELQELATDKEINSLNELILNF